jgi:very-short-patch-repair endonuclease
MKKWQSPDSFKHKAIVSKEELRRLNQRIILAFKTIREASPKQIHQQLGWLKLDLEENWDNMNPVHVTTLLNNLSKLDINVQGATIDIVTLSLGKCNRLLSRMQTLKEFTVSEVTQIFNALPKLPIVSNETESLVMDLLKRAAFLADKESLAVPDSAMLLSALAKLDVDLLKQKKLINDLLQVVATAPVATIRSWSIVLLSELWQFCVFSKSKVSTKAVDKLFDFIEPELKRRKREPIKPTKFHTAVYEVIVSLISEDSKVKISLEHPVGAYSLDIVFLEKKLNIEIDGPSHYRDGALKLIHQFRDSILQAYDHWEVIRIPYFEWEELKANQEKGDYLLQKLKDHSDLFSPPSFERLQTLELKSIEQASSDQLQPDSAELPSASIVVPAALFQPEPAAQAAIDQPVIAQSVAVPSLPKESPAP